MFRFLRKYNKYILAVFGTLLLITFLVPYAITRIGQASSNRGFKWATIVGPDGEETLKSIVLDQARNELQYLQNDQLSVGTFGIMDDAVHWYLLVREAEEAIGNIAPASLGPIPTNNPDPGFSARTYAKFAAVNTLIQLHLDGTPFALSGKESGRLSDRRIKHLAKEKYHSVLTQMVMIKAAAPEQAGTFSDTVLQEQLDKYADKLPGEGDMGFGYRLPNRLKLEWLEVSVDSVTEMIKASDALNAVDLRKHWLKKYLIFGSPQANAEVPQDVYDDLLLTLTQAKLKEISRFGHNQLRRKQRSSLDKKDGAFVLPEDWQGLNFVDLAVNIQNDFGVTLPAYHAAGSSWLWTEELKDLKGIGQATTSRFGEIPMALSDLVASVREFNPESTVPIQSQIAGPPLSDFNGSVYFFRITAVDPSRPPHSLDEVKDAVIADLGRILEYDLLAQSKDAVEQLARDEGLLAVAIEHNTVVGQLQNLRIGSNIILPEIGSNEDIIKTIIDRARAFPMDVAFDELSDDQKTFVLPVDDSLVLLVVQLISQSPLTESTYSNLARFGVFQSSVLEQNSDMPTLTEQISQAFSLEALTARYKFKILTVAPTTRPDDTLPDNDKITDDK
ncbi:MAG: hypothetical protein IH984_14240 [Planctomycetes bacterium]|nr:hypothetical protein [Planctomycetota bacterium]